MEYEFDRKIVHSDGGISIIYKPVLTDDERDRRMKQLKKETEVFLKAVIRERRTNEEHYFESACNH